MIEPLVSCVMLTIPGREQMAAEARRCFEQQEYQRRQLITVHGAGSIGSKRNRGAKMSSGEVICHWDDDDLSAPGRLEEQVKRLMETDADIVGYRSLLFADFGTSEAWKYDHGTGNYAVGSSFMYWRTFWESRAFLDMSHSEDNAFLLGDPMHGRARAKVHAIDGEPYLLARIHPGNSQRDRKEVARISSNWQQVEWERVQRFQEGL